MLYLLEVSIYSALLYAVYLAVLRNRATHTWNRAYLLLCAWLPVLLPFLYIPGVKNVGTLPNVMSTVNLPEITISPNQHIAASTLSADSLFTAIYLLISGLLFIRLMLHYVSLKKFVKSSTYAQYPGNIKVITGCGYGPGSFGQYVFFPGEEVQDEILQHELAHISHRHSRDIVCMKLLQCFFWPNVFLVAIMNELRLVHEFEADTLSGADNTAYTHALLNNIFQTRTFPLSHTFFHHPIKRRITMLHKTPQSRSKLRATVIRSGILAASLIAGVIYLQSCNRQKEVVNEIAQTTAAKEPSLQHLIDSTEKYAAAHGGHLQQTNDGKALNYADIMPEATVNIPEFLGANIKYPDAARKNDIEGRVIVKFIIDEQGNLTSPTVVRTPDQTLSDEAIRVIKLMPKWKPGKNKGKNVAVYFTLPISFKLE